MGAIEAEQVRDGWIRRHRRLIAALVLGAFVAPALFFGLGALWFTAREHPGFFGAALLCVVWLVMRVRRNRRADRRRHNGVADDTS